MAIYRGTGLQGEGGISDFSQLVQDAQDAAAAAEQAYENTLEIFGDAEDVAAAVAAAQLAETNAETAEANAELAETNAETAATNAANSASAASTSATNAASSATSASNSASTATTQATNASNSATAAATSASNASTSATNAANSATTAINQATNAATSATSAANSATTATNSANTAISKANEASASASAASASASSASSSAVLAATSAAEAIDHINAALDLYNGAAALEDAVDAAQASATASANSATASANSATQATINGAVQVALATTQATNAANSATAAATSATNAANSATQAANSAASAAAIVTGVASNRPSIRPSLLLDFANTKQLDPRITFSRPTTATYYDGKTVVKAEENLLPQSQAFSTSPWTSQLCTVTTNATTSPDGTNTASLITLASGSTSNAVQNSFGFTTTASNTYTASFYAKAGTQSYIQYAMANDGAIYANFDITNGVTGTSSGAVSTSITLVGNGWYRCVVTLTGKTGSTFVITAVPSTTSTRWPSWSQAGTETFYVWGAQLEQRSTVTAYTPTTTAPITNYIPALQTAVSNDARFDHDPVTGESKGLLIEEQRTNLLTYSSQFDDASWGKTGGTITPYSNVAPDGTLTATKLNEGALTPGQYFVYRNVLSLTSGGTYTLSWYAKAGERSWTVAFLSAPTVYAYFNLSTGTIGNTFGSPNATMTAVGNGWYRCTMTTTLSGTYTAPEIHVSNANGVYSYNGTANNGIYIWGAQLEAGSFPTSYIPTVASQVTRSADSASMTGSNFSSWYRADEGTLYADWNGKSGGEVFTLYTDVSNDIQIYQTSATQASGLVQKSGSGTVANLVATGTAGTNLKGSIAYKTDDFAFTVNGAAVVTDSSGVIPVATSAYIGSFAALAWLNGTIKRISFWPKRLSNSELQGLTS